MFKKAKQLTEDYRLVFKTDVGKKVLKDLAQFCSANTTTYVSGDTNEMLVREGRRMVFLRIASILALEDKELQELYKRQQEGDY